MIDKTHVQNLYGGRDFREVVDANSRFYLYGYDHVVHKGEAFPGFTPGKNEKDPYFLMGLADGRGDLGSS